MLNRLFRSFVAAKPTPIGVDLGSEWLRMAQVQASEEGLTLIAAAETPIPPSARKDIKSRLEFLLEGSRQLLAKGFAGRHVVLGLSPDMLYAQHLRLPKMDEKELRKAIPWEVRGKIPIEPQAAMLRYVIAGDAYRDREPGQEVVVLASNKELVQHYLRMAERAKLEVVGMEPDPLTIGSCLAPLFAKPDGDPVVLFVDVGRDSSRALITQGSHTRFVRFISIGAAKLARAEKEDADAAPATAENGGGAVAVAAPSAVEQLVEELELCRRYYDATFPNLPIERLVFVGGGAGERSACMNIARGLNIAAQVGDPLQRLVKTGVDRVGDVDLRQAAPAWTVALGLSLKHQEVKSTVKA